MVGSSSTAAAAAATSAIASSSKMAARAPITSAAAVAASFSLPLSSSPSFFPAKDFLDHASVAKLKRRPADLSASFYPCAGLQSSKSRNYVSALPISPGAPISARQRNEYQRIRLGRGFHCTPAVERYKFLLAHAFQGKPSEAESAESQESSAGHTPPPTHPKEEIIPGFPLSHPVGAWRSTVLGEKGNAGEDAVLVARRGDGSGDTLIGVADGVGSWKDSGVDPALFSQALMYHASNRFLDSAKSWMPYKGFSSLQSPGLAPIQILADAFNQTILQKEVPAGSSTACLLTLEADTGRLRSANLGDSGFIVLREEDSATEQASLPAGGQDLGRGVGVPGKRPLSGALYRSAPQQYYFNAPYQLSKIPDAIRKQWKAEGGGESLECLPNSANTWECQLKHGDLIIVASDGAWDNVWGREWVDLARYLRSKHHETFLASQKEAGSAKDHSDPWAEEKTLVEVIAYNALQYTLMCQFSQKKRSPFEAEAEKSRIRFPGGKVDDVAIVVALVVEDQATS